MKFRRRFILEQTNGDVESGRPRAAPVSKSTFSQDGSLTPTLKSVGTSLLLHASVAAALYAIPTSTNQRFSQSGQIQVVSIQARQERPSSAAPTFSASPVRPLASELDSAVDRMRKPEAIDRTKLPDAVSERQRHDLVKLQPPAVPELPIARQRLLQRRPPDEITPDVKPLDPPRRQASPRRMATTPPTAAMIPIEQFVGLEKDSSADLTENRPPAYPQEGVRRQLEGVVLLELKITAKGEVESVTVIKSSGHPILDDAAVHAVATWRGQPARRWGRPIESIERLPIRFRL
jgi:protein TonB